MVQHNLSACFASPLFRISGDCTLLVEYGQDIDPVLNEKVRHLALLIQKKDCGAIREIIPSYSTLALRYEPAKIKIEELKTLIISLESSQITAAVPKVRVVEIPVCYGGDFGPDMADVTQHTGLHVDEVIKRHSAPLYRIYAIGFAPGFCYLGGLDHKLHIQRLASPRLKVATGSVGIADGQTGVYPQESPGGWRIIGRTPLCLFDPTKKEPTLYQAGDSIRFCPISPQDFSALAKREEP